MLEKRIGVVMYQTSHSKGQELVAQRMVRDFNKLGHKAYLITGIFHDGREVFPAEALKKGKGYLLVEDKTLDIPVIRVDSYIANWPPRRILFRDFIHNLEGIVDEFKLNVLITHSTLWNGPEEAAKFVAWRRNMRDLGGYYDPLVFCHMSHFQEPSTQRYSLAELTFRTAWNKLSLSKILETANLVLVVTPYEKQAKLKMGAKPEKLFLFPGGVDDRTFLQYCTEDSDKFLENHNICPNARIVSYLGTIEERKNPLAVLKVAEKLKDNPSIHFVLAGKGDSSYAAEVENVARGLCNVSYLGEISDKEKIHLIKASNLNILMSKLEALGIVQLEFMYNGVPVITSAAGGQSWVVQNGIEGVHLKSPADVEGAASAILGLLSNEKRYQQMSKESRQKAEKFTISGLIRELDFAIEKELINESKLKNIPRELQETFIQPEYAVKSWLSFTTRVIATNKRIFIKKGIFSRIVAELRYSDIKSIHHLRRYPWQTPLVGATISLLLILAPLLSPIFSRAFVTDVIDIMDKFAEFRPIHFLMANNLDNLLFMLPFIISMIVFLLESKSCFSLCAPGMKPIYLPGKFKDAIGFIRKFQDNSEPEGEPDPVVQTNS